MRAGTGDRVYEGNGGRSYIAEPLEIGAVMFAAIVAKVGVYWQLSCCARRKVKVW